MDSKNPTTDLLNILGKAMDANMYGSVEVYLEDGQITQITQRIIKKIRKVKPITALKRLRMSDPQKDQEVTLKFHN